MIPSVSLLSFKMTGSVKENLVRKKNYSKIFASQLHLCLKLCSFKLVNLWFSDVFRGIKREYWEEKD